MIEQASLVIGEGNWAVKSDSLLGYKINGGKYYPREMSVVRATTGTRINEDGLVELVPYNLLTYSEQFDNVAWTKFNATVTANTAVAPDGNTTADTITSNASSGGDVYLSINISGVHTLSAYFKEGTTNICRLGSTVGGFADFNLTNQTYTLNSGISASITSVGNGWNRCTLTVDITSTTLIYLSSKDISTKTVYAWGAQLVEGSSVLDYLPTTDRLDVARIDYSSGSGALLVEPQRTNLLTYSEDFGEWSASAGGISSIESNYAISPDGVINAYKVNFVVQNDSDLALYRGHSVTGGATYTYSIYIKGEGSNIGKDIVLKSKRSNGDSAGTTTTQTLTDEWVRVDFTTTYAANNTVANFYISSNDATSCLVYGAQAELGSYQTSYIPTQAATVTRNADVISKTGISDLIGQTEGTMFLEINSGYLESYTQRVFTLSDGTSNNLLGFQLTGSNQLTYYVISGGALQALITKNSPAITLGQNAKIAAAYKANDFVLYVNGVLIGTDTSGSVPTTSSVTFANIGGTQPYVGKINAVSLYKTRLTNAELATLTTI